ncbi:hypothetical protein ACTMTF_49040 [Nonomuraea sp. ZG12]|uniref:hypothetical protein n=1 Tax=Nonomuraea sp. ZG12 TaxID=3452207 RepID=UPI003F8BDDFC
MARMTKVEKYAAIRRDSRMEGLSQRALARKYAVSRRTVAEALTSAWPAPRKAMTPRRSRLDPFKPVIDQMLWLDLSAPRKQRHTVRRIFDRLVAEQDMEGVSYSTVCNYVAVRRPRIRAEAGHGPPEVPLDQIHKPGEEAEVDFGEVWVDLAGRRTKCYMFVFRLSYSGKAVTRSVPTSVSDRAPKRACSRGMNWVRTSTVRVSGRKAKPDVKGSNSRNTSALCRCGSGLPVSPLAWHRLGIRQLSARRPPPGARAGRSVRRDPTGRPLWAYPADMGWLERLSGSRRGSCTDRGVARG